MGALETAFSVGCWLITLQTIAGFLVGKETVLLLLTDVPDCSRKGVGSGEEREGEKGSCLYIPFKYYTVDLKQIDCQLFLQ